MLKCKYLILGSGESGIIIARELIKTGEKVVLVDQAEFGGAYLNSLEYPKNALETEANKFGNSLSIFKDHPDTFSVLRKHRQKISKFIHQGIHKSREKILKKLEENVNFQFIKGKADFFSKSLVEVNSDTERHLLSFESCILTIGKSAISTANLKGLENIPFLFSHNTFTLEEIPSSLAILGVTKNTLEVAGIYANLGVKVSIFDPLSSNKILSEIDKTALNHLIKKLTTKQVEFFFETEILEVKKSARQYALIDKDENEYKCSHLYVPIEEFFEDSLNLEKINLKFTKKGIATNGFGKTVLKNIFAFGECCSGSNSKNKYTLIYEFLLNERKKYDGGKNKPSLMDFSGNFFEKEVAPLQVEYTRIDIFSPVANIGLTEHAAIANFGTYIKSEVISHPYKDGFIKIIYKENNNQVLGISLAGEYANSLEAYAILTLKQGANVKTLRNFIRNFFGL